MKRFTLVLSSALLALSFQPAAALGDANTLATKVSERKANEGRIGEMHFTLTDQNGRERNRTATLVHSEKGDVVKIAIHFTAPAAISNTAFLSHDHISGKDQTWLYLPATERVRRLPSSDRGDAFMGTDLTYGDVKDNFKFQLDDWQFSGGEETTIDGRMLLSLSGTATDRTRKETGYGSFDALIDPKTLFPTQIIYSDVDGAPYKKVIVLEQALIGGAWTAMHFKAENLQTGHVTDIELKHMRHEPDLDGDWLDASYLDAGAPDI